MKNLKWLLGGLLVALAGEVRAFPELVTHGYVNCIACHVSPTGGSALNDYGRGLSKELLSRWGRSGEEKFLNGAVKTPEWLITGGDVRAIQTYLNNAQVTQRQFFLMQSDVVVGARNGNWSEVATLGVADGPTGTPGMGQFLSRSHYVMNQVTETIEVRAGKFLPQYGINDPNHTLVTRGTLGFGENTESYNVEAAYLGERFDAFLTAVDGRPDDLGLQREQGVVLSSSVNFWDRNKVGVSVYAGQNDSAQRFLMGIWGIFGFPDDFFLLSEADSLHVLAKSTQSEMKGLVTSQRLGWEVAKGLQPYLSAQLAQTDLGDDRTRIDAYGPGIDFFPRPHVELRAEYLKQRIRAMSADYSDMAWLILHYYF